MISAKIINNNNINDIKKLFITQQGFESFLLQGCHDFLACLEELNKLSWVGIITLKKQINKLKCDIIIRFYRFVDIMIRNGLIKVIDDKVMKFRIFHQFLFESLVVPDVIGFIKDDPIRIKQLQFIFKEVIDAMCNQSKDKKW
eukprot:511225_1